MAYNDARNQKAFEAAQFAYDNADPETWNKYRPAQYEVNHEDCEDGEDCEGCEFCVADEPDGEPDDPGDNPDDICPQYYDPY